MDDVAIVGGGIGGLAAAIALHERGIDATVYEAAERLRPAGAGIWVPPNGMAALERLGIAETVADRGVVLDRTAIRTVNGRDLVETDLRSEWVEYPMVSVHRADLHGALVERVPDAALRLGKECTGVSTGAEAATATFADGASVEARVLVGADGIDSAVRASLFPEATPEYAGHVSFRGIADRGLPGDEHRVGRGTWGQDHRVGHAGVDDDRTYWWAGLAVPAGDCDWTGQMAREKLQGEFSTFPDPMPGLIAATDPDDLLRTELRHLPRLETYHEKRVALLGDSAHAMVPNLAQGGAQALEDAVALAGCLDDCGVGEAALATYERRRKPRADRIARQSRLQGRLSGVTNPLLRRLRDGVFRLTPEAVLRRSTAWMFEPEF